MSGVGRREGGNGRGKVLSSTESILRNTRSGDSFGCVVCALYGWMRGTADSGYGEGAGFISGFLLSDFYFHKVVVVVFKVSVYLGSGETGSYCMWSYSR